MPTQCPCSGIEMHIICVCLCMHTEYLDLVPMVQNFISLLKSYVRMCLAELEYIFCIFMLHVTRCITKVDLVLV